MAFLQPSKQPSSLNIHFLSQSRAENICQAGHLRVILPSTLDATMNMPAPFIDIITSNSHDIPPPQVDFSAPPPYDVAANSKLPTYEEVQREKQMEGDGLAQVIKVTFVVFKI
ncbi:hypothetical protein RR48_05785 [Papilio machaon]|uniref:Uncharacterized protein n=1 Tax=Papilio machaon TaxID=76193 RepID=A0A0N1PI01_PAPMA|nr:hypothetical protein RR48_05785 [Papilio machaon]